MRGIVLLAAVWGSGCADPGSMPARTPSRPHPRAEPIVVLEAPEGSGLRRERPAILRVIDAASGHGIEGATVDGPGATERTDTEGFCELPRDTGKPRAWTVTAAGYAPGVANGSERSVLPLFPGAPLRLQVLDTFDRPVAGARVALVGWLRAPGSTPVVPPDFELQHSTTGPKGWGEFAAVTGREFVRVSAARHISAEVPITALATGPDGLVLRLRQWPGADFVAQSPAEPAGMEIEIRDSKSLAPVPDLPIQLESFEPDGPVYAARTGPDGIARVRCAAGEYGCRPRGPFAPFAFDRVNVDASADRRRFLVRAHPNPTIALEIAGLPPGDLVMLAVDGAQRELACGTPVAVAAGVPLVASARRGGIDAVWRIEALEHRTAHRTVAVTWPATVRIAPPSTPWVATSSRPRPGTLLVDVRDAKGRFCSGRVSVDGRWGGAGSRVTIAHVPAGPHRVVIWAPGREVLVEPVTVVAGDVTRLLARLRALDD